MHATTYARRAVAALVAAMLLIAVGVHAAPGAADQPDRPDRSRPAAVAAAAPAAPSVAGARSDAPGGSHPIALAAVLTVDARCADAMYREALDGRSIPAASFAGVRADSRAPPVR